MIIKEREYKTCGHCKARSLVSEAEYGCDSCRTPLAMDTFDSTLLSATVHRHDGAASDMHFCSWRCVLTGLSEAQTDYFISMPFLHFDVANHEISAAGFFEAVRAWHREQQEQKG